MSETTEKKNLFCSEKKISNQKTKIRNKKPKSPSLECFIFSFCIKTHLL